VSTWWASATTGGLTSPSDMVDLVDCGLAWLAGQTRSASARAGISRRGQSRSFHQRRSVVWYDAEQRRTDVHNRYMSQFRVKGSAVCLIAAGAGVKLVNVRDTAAQVELVRCFWRLRRCGRGGAREGGFVIAERATGWANGTLMSSDSSRAFGYVALPLACLCCGDWNMTNSLLLASVWAHSHSVGGTMIQYG
jgi:hypothetical protein